VKSSPQLCSLELRKEQSMPESKIATEGPITLTLTKEEFELLYDAVDYLAVIKCDRIMEPGDDEDKEYSALCRLENEILWQSAHNGQRRPVQR
jgi:hypothetical protein